MSFGVNFLRVAGKAWRYYVYLRLPMLCQLAQPPVTDLAPLVFGRREWVGVPVELLDEPVMRLKNRLVQS